ncbi:MAG: Asp-tRNA(Asn)/Glu-tRNA(Gln) amidotransferase subunit GatB [Melioribacteraceae bacterium]|nr:Asp-tRNA(Asn)/Glu-tRNA(Gln) amidotransferase subunit GatB [Melioribacteraceae bacterium]MDD3556967.1 Asp-tRNA(Asn)/Glu-tRNA(Gln) amidotransferase subunit GatB [Melioribacteraceae bacterium]
MHEIYEPVIGLEVHAQLSTKTKIFCACSTKFGNPPNTNVCPVCLGHPGVLPVLNKKVVEYSIKMGLAVDAKINSHSVFARKNYFYPDLPKGYQISQFELPICENGKIDITSQDGSIKSIGIKRIHMEEDAGKLIHERDNETFIDANRCGVPLIEIVTEPDLRSPKEAYDYLTNLKLILTYLDICDVNMEEGSLRCDANISIRKKGDKKLYTRTEIKNLNSFRNVEKALEFEFNRQIDLIENGEDIVQQTLLWNADLNEATPMRGKEEAHDYRYFPEPDLVPAKISNDRIDEIEKSLPELPSLKFERFIKNYSLSKYDAEILISSIELADYFEKVCKTTNEFKSASNWMISEVLKYLNEHKLDITQFPISPEHLGKLINLIKDGTISGKIGKDVFEFMFNSDEDPEKIVNEKGLLQISDLSELEVMIDSIIAKHPKDAEDYRNGNKKVIGFFVGQVMRETNGKANPQLVNKLLTEKLSRSI